jgi:hypothetical protein
LRYATAKPVKGNRPAGGGNPKRAARPQESAADPWTAPANEDEAPF